MYSVLRPPTWSEAIQYFFDKNVQNCVVALKSLMKNLYNFEWKEDPSLRPLITAIDKNGWTEKEYENQNLFPRLTRRHEISQKATLYIDTSWFKSKKHGRKAQCKYPDFHRLGE